MTLQEKVRAVYEALGWTHIYEHSSVLDGRAPGMSYGGPLPRPDLDTTEGKAAALDLLFVTLRSRDINCEVTAWADSIVSVVFRTAQERFSSGVGPDLRTAIIEAAYTLLCGEGSTT